MDEIPLTLRPPPVSPYPTDEQVPRRIGEAVARKSARYPTLEALMAAV